MKILIVEDDPSLTRLYKEFFGRLMPEASMDIVASVGGYVRIASETRYDAYIMDETIDGQKSAFEHIAPKILAKFPDAFILHNGSDSDPDNISQQERIHRIRFARGPDGRVVTCNKNIAIAIEVLKALVVPRGDVKKELPAREKAPFCQRQHAQQLEFRRPLACCRH